MHDYLGYFIIVEGAANFLLSKPQIFGALTNLFCLIGNSKRSNYFRARGTDSDSLLGNTGKWIETMDVEHDSVITK